MVNLSPDTKVGSDWMNGHIYGETNIQCFSRVHCWQLCGVPVMPQTGEVFSVRGLAAAASPFSHDEGSIFATTPPHLAAFRLVRRQLSNITQ